MRILAVDDDPLALRLLTEVLGDRHEVIGYTDGARAIEALGTDAPEIVLTDLRMPPPDGFAVMSAALRRTPPPAVIVLSALDEARAAIRALREGATDFLVKPVEACVIRRVVEGLEITRPAAGEEDFGLIGSSPAIRLVRRMIPALAANGEVVLVLGETGTGKELLAQALHAHGPRREGPFVTHNMAATPAELAESLFFGHVRGSFSGAVADQVGLFEQARGGTLFLDEMDSFPLPLQAKLLRVLETHRVQRIGAKHETYVDVRVVAASCRDLCELVACGAFRADLYYRLKQLEVWMPPLRERIADVPCLVERFLAEISPAARISSETLERLEAHDWPGNVRELRSAVRAGALMAGPGPILPEHLPRVIGRAGPAHSGSLEEVAAQHILTTLDGAGGNRSRAARLLGIDRGTLARKLAALGRRKPSS
jgi:DNA-binding NtrC family response regulator